MFYGPDWGWIAGMTTALTFVGAVRAIGNPVGFVLMAMNRVRFGLVVNVLKTAVTIPMIVGGGVLFGLDGLIGGLLLSSVLGFVVTYVVLRVILGIRISAFLRACSGGPLLALPMAVLLMALSALPEGSFLRLFPVEIVLAGLVLGATALLAPGRDLAEARSLVLSRLPQRFRPGRATPPGWLSSSPRRSASTAPGEQSRHGCARPSRARSCGSLCTPLVGSGRGR